MSDAVDGAVDVAVRDAVDDAVDGAVSVAVDDAVRGAVRDAVRVAVGDAVDGAVSGAVGDAVGVAVIKKALFETIKRCIGNYMSGQFWPGGYWWGGAFTSFFREVCDLDLNGDLWDRGLAYEGTIQSACFWYPHKDFVMVCERPTVINRELTNPDVTRGWGSHRLHCGDGPAVGFRDGWGVYAIHGVRVPAHVVERPESITVAEIEAEQNAEVRRVMMERYGYEKYILDCDAMTVDSCPVDHPIIGLRDAKLRVKKVPDDEPIVFVDLLNSTPEPDGTVKRYLMRVDPNAYGGDASRICQAAAASTWRSSIDGELVHSDWRDYTPIFES